MRRPIRPTSIFLMPAGTVGAGLIQQALTDIFPDRIGSEVADGLRLLHLDNARAARAFDAEQMALNISESALLNGHPRLAGRARVLQQRLPKGVWYLVRGARIGRRRRTLLRTAL